MQKVSKLSDAIFFFLVACARLYTPLCRSVCRSPCRSTCLVFTNLFLIIIIFCVQIPSASDYRARIQCRGSSIESSKVFPLTPQDPFTSSFPSGKKAGLASETIPLYVLPDYGGQTPKKKMKPYNIYARSVRQSVGNWLTDQPTIPYLSPYAEGFTFPRLFGTKEPLKGNHHRGISWRPSWPTAANFSSTSYSIEWPTEICRRRIWEIRFDCFVNGASDSDERRTCRGWRNRCRALSTKRE